MSSARREPHEIDSLRSVFVFSTNGRTGATDHVLYRNLIKNVALKQLGGPSHDTTTLAKPGSADYRSDPGARRAEKARRFSARTPFPSREKEMPSWPRRQGGSSWQKSQPHVERFPRKRLRLCRTKYFPQLSKSTPSTNASFCPAARNSQARDCATRKF